MNRSKFSRTKIHLRRQPPRAVAITSLTNLIRHTLAITTLKIVLRFITNTMGLRMESRSSVEYLYVSQPEIRRRLIEGRKGLALRRTRDLHTWQILIPRPVRPTRLRTVHIMVHSDSSRPYLTRTRSVLSPPYPRSHSRKKCTS